MITVKALVWMENFNMTEPSRIAKFMETVQKTSKALSHQKAEWIFDCYATSRLYLLLEASLVRMLAAFTHGPPLRSCSFYNRSFSFCVWKIVFALLSTIFIVDCFQHNHSVRHKIQFLFSGIAKKSIKNIYRIWESISCIEENKSTAKCAPKASKIAERARGGESTGTCTADVETVFSHVFCKSRFITVWRKFHSIVQENVRANVVWEILPGLYTKKALSSIRSSLLPWDARIGCT